MDSRRLLLFLAIVAPIIMAALNSHARPRAINPVCYNNICLECGGITTHTGEMRDHQMRPETAYKMWMIDQVNQGKK